MDQEVLDARAKLAAKFSNAGQIGGKGTHSHLKTQLSQILGFFGNFCYYRLLQPLYLCRYPKKKEEACHCLECQ